MVDFCFIVGFHKSFFFQQQDVLAVLISGKVHDCLVHRDQNQILAQGEPQQVGVRDLLGAV